MEAEDAVAFCSTASRQDEATSLDSMIAESRISS
jgi:hypothetical protein